MSLSTKILPLFTWHKLINLLVLAILPTLNFPPPLKNY